jgi:hypothetical protein
VDGKRTVRVRPHRDGWEVIVEGDRGGLLFETMPEARASAGAWAEAHPPAVVVVEEADGSEVERLEYP